MGWLVIEVVGEGTTDRPPGTYSLGYNEPVWVVALPAPGWYFKRWAASPVFSGSLGYDCPSSSSHPLYFPGCRDPGPGIRLVATFTTEPQPPKWCCDECGVCFYSEEDLFDHEDEAHAEEPDVPGSINCGFAQGQPYTYDYRGYIINVFGSIYPDEYEVVAKVNVGAGDVCFAGAEMTARGQAENYVDVQIAAGKKIKFMVYAIIKSPPGPVEYAYIDLLRDGVPVYRKEWHNIQSPKTIGFTLVHAAGDFSQHEYEAECYTLQSSRVFNRIETTILVL